MPHINCIRLVNVHFNNATQFYDDFYMELGGKNTTYDLENGGGKSLLLLMILQTVLPKSNLRREKPLSLLFQGGKERTSHVAVEWILEEGSDYKYLLTGFSARKRKGNTELASGDVAEEDEVLQASEIEHLNWCVFYNDYKITNIRSLALRNEEAGKKSYAAFDDIRKYVQQMRQKGLPASLFDRIDQYQRYISAHHLLPAEWNIIKGINSGENNIESYFRQNTTSRKLIENLFVKLIEDVEALDKDERNKNDSLLLADTLIEIRDRLNEYRRLKGHMSEYEKIKEYYDEFGRRNDEFLKCYLEYEACKNQAVAIKNLIEEKIQALEKEQETITAKLENNHAGYDEALQLKKLLEAGLVEYRKKKLITVQLCMVEEQKQAEQRQEDLEKQLNNLLTLEGYGEYRNEKAKVMEIHRRLQTLETDGDVLKQDHRQAGGRLKFLVDKLFKELEASEVKAKHSRAKLEEEGKQAQENLIIEEKKASELGVIINRLSEQETNLQARFQEINNFFLAMGETEAIFSPEQFLSKLDDELKGYTSEKEFLSDRLTVLEEELHNTDIAIENLKGDIKGKLAAKTPLEDWLTGCRNVHLKLQEKAAAFGESSIEEYGETLRKLIYQENLNKLEKEIEVSRRRQKKNLSEERGYYVPNEEILALAAQLSTKCEFVQAGIDWIAGMEPKEKETILQEMLCLPFAVIVDKVSFGKLKKGSLRVDFSSDYPVPVVNLDTVRLMNAGTQEDVYYLCGFSDLLLDNACYEEYLLGIEAQLETMDKEIIAAGTRISELTGELSEVDAFYAKYPLDEIEKMEKMVTSIETEIADLNAVIDDLHRKKGGLTEEKATLNGRHAELAGLTADCRNKIEKLMENQKNGEKLIEVRKQLGEKRKNDEAVKDSIQKIKNRAVKLKEQLDAEIQRLERLNLDLHDLKKERQQLDRFVPIENNLALTQARAEYRVLHEALSGRYDEESRLRDDLKDAENKMEAINKRIFRDCGGNLEEVEKEEAQGNVIIIPTEVMIGKAKEAKAENGKKLKALGERIMKINLAIERFQGQLKEILRTAEVEPTTLLPQYDTQSRYQEEVDQAQQLIMSFAGEIENANKALERMKDSLSKLFDQKEDYESFMDQENVTDNELIASEIQEYRQFQKEYRRLQDIIGRLVHKWDDRIGTVQAEANNFVIHEPIEELGKIRKPESAAQCQSRKHAFVEYIANIDEQMKKITTDIEQLESYQEDFTRRCGQRAELVLGHLKKLEALSRIEVYGRRTNMIELNIKEFEDKDKHLRLKAHIDAIIREIGEVDVVERKRVAARLSTKELLAQIADMDKAAVRLYKIESIPENSRFYRWEHAIGSEGQNNSLYFIFAACLISFIRMLSITNVAVKTKKVIIADNPFGATSAVYLWDPMFKIMKQNDIQLIAPGHRIPREITSRFGVSYLLNQDILQDGRMRVVVKDVRAEEDEDVMRYVAPEQLTMY
ncbi:hypothetical protein [Phosphitispora sp. TUW77]|uniref:hypothetical protein n=1 Tax=Phosphitispora sp. TUW77 TaxID=3152361 RepID=UPI003AB3F31B